MSVTGETTQMLWVSDPDVLVAATTPVLTLLAAQAAPTQLLSLHSPQRSKQAHSSCGKALGSSLTVMQRFIFIANLPQKCRGKHK